MKQLTDLEKKIRRRIAKTSKRGRYLIVTRRGKRSRPGRKKNIKCDTCGGFLPTGNFGLTTCGDCLNKIEQMKHLLVERQQVMNIPKMTKGT